MYVEGRIWPSPPRISPLWQTTVINPDKGLLDNSNWPFPSFSPYYITAEYWEEVTGWIDGVKRYLWNGTGLARWSLDFSILQVGLNLFEAIVPRPKPAKVQVYSQFGNNNSTSLSHDCLVLEYKITPTFFKPSFQKQHIQGMIQPVLWQPQVDFSWIS